MSPALAGESFTPSATWEAQGTIAIRFRMCVYQKVCRDIEGFSVCFTKNFPFFPLTQLHSARRQRESKGETIKPRPLSAQALRTPSSAINVSFAARP